MFDIINKKRIDSKHPKRSRHYGLNPSILELGLSPNSSSKTPTLNQSFVIYPYPVNLFFIQGNRLDIIITCIFLSQFPHNFNSAQYFIPYCPRFINNLFKIPMFQFCLKIQPGLCNTDIRDGNLH